MSRWMALAGASLLALGLSSPATAEDHPTRFDRPVPDGLSDLKLDAPRTADPGSFALAERTDADQAVIVQLAGPALSETGIASPAGQAAFVAALAERQAKVSSYLAAKYGAREIASLQIVLNAVFLEVDADAVAGISREAGVVRVAPVANYELELGDTVPLIGGDVARRAGLDGAGVSVAVLDSGLDYTHAAFGGPGTLDAYEAAYGTDPADVRNTTLDGLFPTARIVGGFDFVGEVWPNGPGEFGPDDLAFDPDPIDFQGHGTHVADIIGGLGGVAPGAELYAFKVCSAVASSCNGISLMLGLEAAADPNGDGSVEDRVDIVNMSLGSIYGQPFDDDLALAVDNATALGILTVAAAGNSADKPYALGTPAAAPTALAVAQTHVPAAFVQGIDITEPAAETVGAVFQDWSAPLQAALGPAPVTYGGFGCSAGDDPNSTDPADAPYADDEFAGQIVLVDRGECNFSIKIFNIQRAGGLAGIIGLVAPGEPFSGALGDGGPFTIPGYMVSQAAAARLDGTTATISPDSAAPAAGNVVGSSSRGPTSFYQMIKPEIGAPGASVSATAGSGTGSEPFGGTSGAAPMVSGSAALVLQARPNLTPMETKALLVNTGEVDIGNSSFTEAPAPVSRLGGGEVRADRAVAAVAAAWDVDTGQAALSFGMVEVATPVSLVRTVQVHNYSDTDRIFAAAVDFRSETHAQSGAVSLTVPEQIAVAAGAQTTFDVVLDIDPARLPPNFMNSGAEGASSAALTLNEFDGFVELTDGPALMRIPWHVLPRQSAHLVPEAQTFPDGAFPEVIALDNQGAGFATNDAFALVALSPDLPEGERGAQSPTPDLRAFGVNTFPVPAGFCSVDESFVWAFAFSTWEEQSHLVPVSHIVELDVDRDGVVDFVVLNRDASASPPGFNTVSDGRQLSWVIGEAVASAFFFAEHATNTANTVLYLCAEQIGFSAADLLETSVDVRVTTQDFYFGGPRDVSDIFTITPLGEQYVGLSNDIPGFTLDPGGLGIFDFGPFPGNSPELGVLLFTNGDRGPGARGGATDSTEALIFTPPSPAITGFVLVDAGTDRDVAHQDPLAGTGAVIDLSVTPHFNIRVETTDRTVGSVAVGVVDADGRPVHFRRDRRTSENFFPFSVGGDWPIGDYQPLELGPGTYTLRATPFSGGSLTGVAGAERVVTFTVVDGR